MLALEEWVVLYIIDTRRSLDLGLLFYHPGFFTYPWAFHSDGWIFRKAFLSMPWLFCLAFFLGGRVSFPRTQIMMLPSNSDFFPLFVFLRVIFI